VQNVAEEACSWLDKGQMTQWEGDTNDILVLVTLGECIALAELCARGHILTVNCLSLASAHARSLSLLASPSLPLNSSLLVSPVSSPPPPSLLFP